MSDDLEGGEKNRYRWQKSGGQTFGQQRWDFFNHSFKEKKVYGKVT